MRTQPARKQPARGRLLRSRSFSKRAGAFGLFGKLQPTLTKGGREGWGSSVCLATRSSETSSALLTSMCRRQCSRRAKCKVPSESRYEPRPTLMRPTAAIPRLRARCCSDVFFFFFKQLFLTYRVDFLFVRNQRCRADSWELYEGKPC